MIGAPALLLSEVFPPQVGGSGRWLSEIYRRFPNGSAIVAAGEYAHSADSDSLHELPVTRIPLAMPDWGIRRRTARASYWKGFRALVALVRQNRVDAIHCARCLPEGWLALMLRIRFRIPFVCYVHGEELTYGNASRELGWMMRVVMKQTNFLIANSNNTADILRDRWRVPASRIHVLHPGVNTAQFSPKPRNDDVRQKLGWSGREVVLTVGRLQARKGHDMLIRALPTIRARAPDVLYAIVGDGEERGRLEALVDQLGVRHCVRFHGEIADKRLIECYQQCDVFALPNRTVGNDFEGFGMVLVEAQSCGKAVIAGASGGTAETMLPGETGLIVPCEAPALLAGAVTELLLDKPRCQRMGAGARRWVVAQFDWDHLADKAAALFGASRSFAGMFADGRERGASTAV